MERRDTVRGWEEGLGRKKKKEIYVERAETTIVVWLVTSAVGICWCGVVPLL